MAEKEFARSLRRRMTDAEQRLWYHLRARRLSGYKFRRQHVVGPYVVDFVCIEARLVVEADGGQHAADGARDARRTRYLENRGYRVLRFWNDEVLRDTRAVLEGIEQALAASQRPPNRSQWP